jgi:hypothetical protein
VTEKFKPVKFRDDESLRETIKTIRDRLKWTLEVTHPVTPNETLSRGSDDSKIAFLRDRLSDAISWLEPLDKSDCSRSEARDAWDKVFNTDYFANCEDVAETDSAAKSVGWATAASILGSVSAEAAGAKPVNKSGSNRYA